MRLLLTVCPRTSVSACVAMRKPYARLPSCWLVLRMPLITDPSLPVGTPLPPIMSVRGLEFAIRREAAVGGHAAAGNAPPRSEATPWLGAATDGDALPAAAGPGDGITLRLSDAKGPPLLAGPLARLR